VVDDVCKVAFQTLGPETAKLCDPCVIVTMRSLFWTQIESYYTNLRLCVKVRYASLTEAVRLLGCFDTITDIQPTSAVLADLKPPADDSMFSQLFHELAVLVLCFHHCLYLYTLVNRPKISDIIDVHCS